VGTWLPADLQFGYLLADGGQAPLPLTPVLGSQQRGDSADASGIYGDRQSLLAQLCLDAGSKRFVFSHGLPVLSLRPWLGVSNTCS